MVELALTKIEQGMAKGGTAIGANFDKVKVAVDSNTADRTHESTYTLTGSSLTEGGGGITLTRKAAGVRMSGLFHLIAALANNQQIMAIPGGYTPIGQVQVTLNAAEGGKTVMARIDAGGSKLYSTGAVAADGWYWIETSYTTDDDTPE
ncbi:hypothetical protein [Lacticaseibacillus daqingensis]|uniref:hypothetical protein n=1 Tax=Lacticaseibacillus daqingensis TaxID=2486014 RepID=UPI000F7676CD|nr:hypothetical protein [Lacticaseibacillus daqingensis]